MNEVQGMGPVEQFAVLQAVYKELGKVLGTGDPGNLRGAVEGSYRQLYEMSGATSFDIRIAGEKVGTFSFEKKAPVGAHVETSFRVTDSQALWDWIEADDGTMERRYAQDHAESFASYVFESTGEMPGGCAFVDVNVPARPAGIGRGTARIDPELVRKHATSLQIAESVMGFLPEPSADDKE